MSVAKLDENSRPTLTALSSLGDGSIVTLYANPTTHRLLVDSSGTLTITVGSTTITGGVTGQLLYDDAGVVGELTTATYPSLTELSYVKGVTSAIQTQINAKGAGTVTTVSVTTANGVSGSVATATTTPAITLTLGAITPTTVNGNTFTTGSSTYTGTAGQTYTFPTTSATIARTDAANTFTGVQTVTNVTLPTNGQILLTVPTSDGHATGHTTNAFVSGYTSSAVGDLVYLDSSSKWQKTDANTLALYNGILGIALAVAATDATLLVALPGSFVYATAFPALTIGSPVYMSETAGAITHTAPVTTDSATRVIGWAIHADKIFFNPSGDYITHI